MGQEAGREVNGAPDWPDRRWRLAARAPPTGSRCERLLAPSTIHHVSRVVLEDALELLRRQSSSQPPERPLLGTVDEGLAKAFVQRRTCSVRGAADQPVRVAHERMVDTA